MEVFDLRVMYDVRKLVRIALQRVQPAWRDVRMPGEHDVARSLDVSQVAPKRASIPREGIASDAVQAGTNCVERLGFYREGLMSKRRGCIGIAGLLFGVMAANMALAQKQGGVLRVFHRDSPASMSILEEGSISAIMPMMGVFNNLVLFNQHVRPNSEEAIAPETDTAGAGRG